MFHAIRAGVSLGDYYKAAVWEVVSIVDNYLREKDEKYKEDWERARFIMSAMTDTKSIKFPWERTDLNTSDADWARARENFKKWEENAKKTK